MQDDLCHKTFRHAAGFGKRMEFWIIGEMLLRNLDVYIPFVDDRGVDAIIRHDNGTFAEVQIKAHMVMQKMMYGVRWLYRHIASPDLLLSSLPVL